jgi:hypothetical protein
LGRLLRLRSTPLRSSRSVNRSRLVSLRVDILGNWGVALVGGACRSLTVLQKLQTSLDVDVGRVKVSRTLVRVKSVRSLVVARFILGHG